MNRIFTILCAALLLSACGSYESFQNEATKEYSSEQMKKFAKYMIQGKTLYTSYCSNCHQADGAGLGKVYPPLAKADYMLTDMSRSLCIIKNGMQGEIKVNGVLYSQKMPDNNSLTDLEVAEIATYINNSWGNAKGLVSVKTVQKSLANCKD
ncbi:c-type cytochrome [Marivirga atlantica]|jgi:mono/diheme cytochrome c family protein|uniref:Cytochrome c n=1 Tax=Marivirga atlantica TaxID=1548457 RepID=A0A937A9N6_9BACT|nr:cytochrome c [Marivirga atlantica]MBL0764876.1 cytochrome c [Marivirga atlantica]